MKKETSYFWQHYALKKAAIPRSCEQQGCTAEGNYRAPRRDCSQNIKDDTTWHWLCLTHVRDYNATWNFYKDMTEDEIITHWERDITWDRPTWPLGSWQSTRTTKPFLRSSHQSNGQFQDPFGLFEESINAHAAPPPPKMTTAENEAIVLFNLPPNFNQDDLQKAYRTLVKQHHPDVNGGCVKAEAYIKTINLAYHLLKQTMTTK